MYSTCLFCHRSLGSNDAIEAFPIGRRLAFDSAKGRLWAVCPFCARWNLAPLDERWEALEQCERWFHDTRIRVSTDNIGLARLREGTELVRIGEPLRPEFAAWRYTAQVARRRRRNLFVAAGATAAVGGLMAGLWTAGIGFAGIQALQWVPRALERRRDRRVVHKEQTPTGNVSVRFGEVRRAVWIPPSDEQPGALELTMSAEDQGTWANRGRKGVMRLSIADPRAHRLLAIGMQRLNRFVGSPRHVEDALGWLEAFGNPLGSDGFVLGRRTVSGIDGAAGEFLRTHHDGLEAHYHYSRPIAELPGYLRLALEMAAHEEQERQFLSLHLSVLQDAWKEAEAIAAIADDLLLPDWLRTRLGG